jgi:hypothetical protein
MASKKCSNTQIDDAMAIKQTLAVVNLLGKHGVAVSGATASSLSMSVHSPPFVDSRESLTGQDRPELSGTTKEVTKRNNTDHILDRLINWQYLLLPIKLFYILP